MLTKTQFLSLAAGALFISLPALAQNGHDHGPASAGQPAVTSPATPIKPTGQFSNDEFRAIAGSLTGYWRANIQGSEVVLGVGPVSIKGMPDVLYAELSRAQAPHRPFRQSFWQLHHEGGKVHLRVLELTPKPTAEHLVGFWAAPEAFPPLSAEQFKESYDIELTKTPEGYKGATTKRYPSSHAGATEMTSEMTIAGDTFVSADRGYKADGTLAWGPKEGEGYSFKRDTSGGPRALHLEGGVVVIDYPNVQQTEPAKPGDRVIVIYKGYLPDGKMFDASEQRGMPFSYIKGSPMLEGWNRAMTDARRGMNRRIYIPAALAHGEDTNNNRIPPHSNLIYDVQVLNVGPAPAPKVVTPTGTGSSTIQPVDPNDPVLKKIQPQIDDLRRQAEEKRKLAEPRPPKEAPSPK